MIIFPAIDIKDGRCVRLFQGDFDTVEQVADDPLATAQSFRDSGAEWVHMVDLDGAKYGARRNTDIFLNVAANSGLKVEVGGGIRDMETVDFYISHGISRVILGSAAVKDPQFVADAVQRYGDRIAVGIDAKDRMVSAEGWLDVSDIDFITLAVQMEKIGVRCIIFTDISKDGTLSGPNMEQLTELNNAVKCDIVASGGIKSIDDIIALKKAGLYGAICGKSIYRGTLDLCRAIKTSKGE